MRRWAGPTLFSRALEGRRGAVLQVFLEGWPQASGKPKGEPAVEVSRKGFWVLGGDGEEEGKKKKKTTQENEGRGLRMENCKGPEKKEEVGI